MAAGKERGLGRIQEKLNASISEGSYYEAHQLYKTLYFRLLGQSKFVELIDLLENGARLLLEKQQMESGSDLAIILIDVLIKSKIEITEEWISKVTKLFSLMNPSMPERETYVANATRWSMGTKTSGHPSFHSQIAKIYWDQKNTQSARQHFLRSNDGESFGTMLIEMHTSRGFKSEVDIFVAQAVLHTLTLRRKELAQDTFKQYIAKHPDIKQSGVPFAMPVLNFISFLLECIELKNMEKFKEIVEKYQKHIVARDASYADYLEKIGNIYFGIPIKPKQRGNGLMGNFLNSLMTNMDIGDSSSDEEYSNARTHQTQPVDLE